MADQELVTVKDPTGELGTVAKTELPQVLKHGFTVPDNSEIQAHNDKIEFGTGIGNVAKTFGEAAASSATFGASRELENALGVTTPEAQAKRAQQNPVARTLGDVAGIATPLGAESLGAKFFNPVAKVAGIGAKAGEAAGALAAEGSLASNIMKSGAQGAAEGLFYGAGQTVTEHALGDPNVNGQKLLHNMGYGALLGGGIGAGFGTAETLVPKAVTTARDSLDKLKTSLIGDTEDAGILGKAYAKASSFVSGKPEESILEGWTKRHELLESPEAREQVYSKFSDSLQDHFDNLNTVLSKANKEIRPQETEELLSSFPAEGAIKQSANVWESIDNTIKEMNDHAALYPSSVSYKLNGIKEEFIKKAGNFQNASDVYSSLNWLKKQIDDRFPIWGKTIPPEWKDAVSALRGLRSSIKENLENESIWGEAAARQSAFNESRNNFLTTINSKNEFSKAFLKKGTSASNQIIAKVDQAKVRTFLSQTGTLRSEVKAKALDDFIESSRGLLDQIESTYKNVPKQTFDKSTIENLINKNQAMAENAQAQASLAKNLGMLNAGGHNAFLGEAGALAVGFHHPILGAAIEGMNALRNPGLSIQRMAKIEQAINKTTNMISKGASAIFKSGTKSGKNLSGYIGSRISSEDHEEREEKINKFMNDQDHALNVLNDSTEGVYLVAPNTATSLRSAAIRASSFLQSKLPQATTGPLEKKVPPSQAELAKFERYYQTVENPISVLHDIKSAKISNEQIETLSAVYPELYDEMKSQVFEKMIDHANIVGKGTISYQTKIGLSQFLGQPIDQSLSPQSILSNQQIFIASMNDQKTQQPPLKPRAKGLDKLDRAGRVSNDYSAMDEKV